MTGPDHPGPSPRPLVEGLRSVSRRLGGAPPDVLAVVFGRWADVVGDALAGRCQPVAVRDATLVVAVAEPGAATEVRFRGAAILARAEELAGQPVAARLEVRVRPSP